MNDRRESDSRVVPAKLANKAGKPAAELVEERRLDEGNTGQQNACRTQSRDVSASSALERVRQVAVKDRDARFTALLHHVDVDRLCGAYRALSPKAAAGVDGETWESYGQNLEENLRGLHVRVQRGAYRAKPSRRVFIPKADGGLRPLGVAALEDKIVQRALVEVLNAIYEADFLGFSYGFRPGRGPHDALDALTVAIEKRKVNWVLDADFRDFFTGLDHSWLVKFLEHRIADKRVLRLIQKWLRAGVIEDGRWTASEEGSPQGATVSPLLANVYLHYVFDLWVQQWRSRHARGEVIVVRYADDVVLGFQHQSDAERFRKDLERRLVEFGLALNAEKTRLIRFGRFAAQQQSERDLGRPETFDFLGFTHYCAKTKDGVSRSGAGRSRNAWRPSSKRSRPR
jgi:RNA-directed DNA polymerase